MGGSAIATVELERLDETRDVLHGRLLCVVRALIQVEDRRAELLLRLVERRLADVDDSHRGRARDARGDADDLTAMLVAVEKMRSRPAAIGTPQVPLLTKLGP